MTFEKLEEMCKPYKEFLAQCGITTKIDFNGWSYKNHWICDLVHYTEDNDIVFKPCVRHLQPPTDSPIGVYAPLYFYTETFEDFKKQIANFISNYKIIEEKTKIERIESDFN